MALGTPALATPFVGAGGVTTTSASFSPANGLLLLAAGFARGSGLPGDISINPSHLSWTFLTKDVFDDGTAPRVKGSVWAAFVSGSPTMTVQINSASAGKVALMIIGISGAGIIPTNFKAANHTNGDPSMTLDVAPAASSCGLTFYGSGGSNALAPPSGFTELDEQIFSTDLIVEAAYDLASPPTTAAYATTNGNTVGLYVEVTELAAGVIRVPVRRSLRTMQSLLAR